MEIFPAQSNICGQRQERTRKCSTQKKLHLYRLCAQPRTLCRLSCCWNSFAGYFLTDRCKCVFLIAVASGYSTMSQAALLKVLKVYQIFSSLDLFFRMWGSTVASSPFWCRLKQFSTKRPNKLDRLSPTTIFKAVTVCGLYRKYYTWPIVQLTLLLASNE